jgi:hypothetical protein
MAPQRALQQPWDTLSAHCAWDKSSWEDATMSIFAIASLQPHLPECSCSCSWVRTLLLTISDVVPIIFFVIVRLMHSQLNVV